jgi:hypothetical protein
MSTNIGLGIAQYNPRWNPEGGRHWSLAVNTTHNRLSGKVSIYQAVNRDDVWLLNHLEGMLVNDEYYYCVLDLGVFRGSDDIVLSIIEDFTATQDSYDTHGHEWSCAWWVLRALRSVQAVYPVMLSLPENDLELYQLVVSTKAEEMATAQGPLHKVDM